MDILEWLMKMANIKKIRQQNVFFLLLLRYCHKKCVNDIKSYKIGLQQRVYKVSLLVVEEIDYGGYFGL